MKDEIRYRTSISLPYWKHLTNKLLFSAESIPTLKNRELIHFAFLLRGFVEKESIHDTHESIHKSILYYIMIHDVK